MNLNKISTTTKDRQELYKRYCCLLRWHRQLVSRLCGRPSTGRPRAGRHLRLRKLKAHRFGFVEKLSDDWGIAHQIIVTDELSKADYRANPTNRCFHCKTSLYTELTEIAAAQGFEHILNGTNLDDMGDHRPGLIAADNHKVKSPLVEAGFHKADIRALAKTLGLENADKPQAACLSSRFPYGTAINQELLAQVEAAETVLADLGFSQCRVRHHGDVARLEIPTEEFTLAVQQHDVLQREIKALGYRFVALDLGGFRSGSLNEALARRAR